MHGRALMFFADLANVNKRTCKQHCDDISFDAWRIQNRRNSWGLFVHSVGKKKQAAFVGGMKNDCKFVESIEKSNALAEPTERAC